MPLFRQPPALSPPSPWDFERLLVNGDAYFASLEEGIKGAQKSIDLETYIFDNDALGARIVELLIAARRRGVTVRVIVDGVGSQGWVYNLGSILAENDIPARVYHQLPWEKLFSSSSNWDPEGTWASRFARINRRDHRKLCIIDGTQAWLGSLNISADHLHSERGPKAWRDTGITLRGENLKFLQAAFDLLWYPRRPKFIGVRHRARQVVKASLGTSVRLNALRRLRKINYRQLLERIGQAKVRLWITTAYFVPTGSFLRALTAAANRCVDVRLLTSAQSDIFFMPWVGVAFQYGLLRAGIQVYNYQPSILHAKTMIIDDFAMVGSSNLNHRSFVHDLEVEATSMNVGTVSGLTESFLEDLQHSKGITLHDFRRSAWWQRALGLAALVFKNWI